MKQQDNPSRGLMGDFLTQNDLLKKIYGKGFNQVKGYILKNSGTEEDAFDIYQDAIFEVALKLNRQEFRFSCEPSTFIYSISRNLWLKELRRRNNERNAKCHFQKEDSCSELYCEQLSTIERIFENNFQTLNDECKLLLTQYIEKVDYD